MDGELLSIFEDSSGGGGGGKQKNPINHVQNQNFRWNSKASLLNASTCRNGEALPPECEQGNIEYKLKLNPSQNRLKHLTTQLKWRLQEGNGEAIYEIGVEDNGDVKGLIKNEIEESLKTLYKMAEKIGASVSVIQEKFVDSEKKRKALEVLIRQIPDDRQTTEIRIAVLGNVEAGKSSLIGVLTQGEPDNGNGRARLNLFRHRHEIRTGHTSSINKEILGFNKFGKPITYSNYQTSEEICKVSSKIIIFIDSGGHEKYLKTTVFSLTASHADYAILVINSLSQIDCGTNLLHSSLALALEVPLIVVVNKIDLCDISILNNLVDDIKKLINSPNYKNKLPLFVETENDVRSCFMINKPKSNQKNQTFKSNIVPIFTVSCVTGEGFNLLHRFLYSLKPSLNSNDRKKLIKQKSLFQIDETFNIPSVGDIVVSGFLKAGLIKEGSVLKAGPLNDGSFIDVFVSSVQRHKVSRQVVRVGESSTLALSRFCSSPSKIQESVCLSKIIRKGMVLLSQIEPKFVCRFFKVRLFTMPHSGIISLGFIGTVYIENVRQTASIIAILDREIIRENESASVIIQFVRHPEYVRKGHRLLLQAGQTKAVGNVIKVFCLK